jgi:hypothetical protein
MFGTSDEKYYSRKENQKLKRDRALAKAKNRGEIAKDWMKTNQLTKATEIEFKALMKKADKDFENSL